MSNISRSSKNPKLGDGVCSEPSSVPPVELDYAAMGRRRDLSAPQDRGVMRVFLFVMIFGMLLPVVLGVIGIVGALLLF